MTEEPEIEVPQAVEPQTFEEAYELFNRMAAYCRGKAAETFGERRHWEKELKPILVWLRKANRLIAADAKAVKS